MELKTVFVSNRLFVQLFSFSVLSKVVKSAGVHVYLNKHNYM